MQKIVLQQHGRIHEFSVLKNRRGYSEPEIIAMLLDGTHPEFGSFDDLNKTIDILPHKLYQIADILVREEVRTQLEDGDYIYQLQFYYHVSPDVNLFDTELWEGSSILSMVGILADEIPLQPTGNYVKQLKKYNHPVNKCIRFVKNLRFKFLFAWYDLWVGVFIDTQKNRLYIFPFPTLGFVVEWKEK